MSAVNGFKRAVTLAKRLYKSGRYKKFSDAVKAAYKQLPASVKQRQTGKSKSRSDKKRKAKAPGKRKSKSGNVYYERRKNRSDKPGSLSGVRSDLKMKLSKALLDYELADTVKATKEAQKRKVKYRKALKALGK